MTDNRELSALMRDAMAAEARQVSASASLTDQLIRTSLAAAAEPPTRVPSRAWQAWVLPAAAAVLLALVASSVFLGSRLLHTSHNQPGNSVAPQPSAPSLSGGPSHPSQAPSPSASGSASKPPVSTPVGPAGGPVPAGFRAIDLTWISTERGWALGTAPCQNAPCTSVVRTADGGKSWVGIPAPVAELAQAAGCSAGAACISGLRFANPLIGYAYGPNTLLLTTDGGAHWSRQDGGAYGLEIANGSVLRVDSQCVPGCDFFLLRSTLGSASWTRVALPAGGQTAGVELARSGQRVALLTKGHTAGGAQHATSVLFTSTDDGSSWTSRGEPCPQLGGEYDSSAVTIADDGTFVLSCNSRQAGQGSTGQFLLSSTDGAAHFTRSAGLGRSDTLVVGAASANVLFAEADGLYRSTDGGQHWQRVTGGPSKASFIGFENGQVGRVLDATGFDQPGQSATAATIWTTRDAGAHWTSCMFR